MRYVIDLLDVLKANYDGKHTISLTDPESRWMMDKKEKIGLNYNLSSSSRQQKWNGRRPISNTECNRLQRTI